jgi:hypothetical protein
LPTFEDKTIAVLIVKEVAVTPFPKPKPVPRRHVVIAHTRVPGGLERLVRIFIADHFELVAEGHAAKAELDRPDVAPVAALGHVGLAQVGLGHVGGRCQGAGRKDAAGGQCRAGPSNMEKIPSG